MKFYFTYTLTIFLLLSFLMVSSASVIGSSVCITAENDQHCEVTYNGCCCNEEDLSEISELKSENCCMFTSVSIDFQPLSLTNKIKKDISLIPYNIITSANCISYSDSKIINQTTDVSLYGASSLYTCLRI